MEKVDAVIAQSGRSADYCFSPDADARCLDGFQRGRETSVHGHLQDNLQDFVTGAAYVQARLGYGPSVRPAGSRER